MHILEYNHLDYSKVKEQYQKVITMLKNDDFYSADVKKIINTPYCRAKLDDSNQLLFKIASYNHKKYALILEVIYNHDYGASRFLRGIKIAQINESQIISNNLKSEAVEPIAYINENISSFNILDKIISFDDAQYEIFKLHFPLIIVGSAGSGKTALTLEKMKECYGDILYITHSPFLVENSRNLYYTNQYTNEDQNIDFLSYRELLETVKVPDSQEINSKIFSTWLAKQDRPRSFNDPNKLYEEFKGVITGSITDKKYLSRENYLALGIKQSIFQSEERTIVYDLFEKYINFLATEKLYDSNLISFEYLFFLNSSSSWQSKYDFIVVDETQDFTNIQLCFILKMLKDNNKNKFILSGDANQIVHPNFFSWNKIKTMFHHGYEPQNTPEDIIRILYKNYRNSPEIIEIANNILKLKNIRFGSIDKESNYLIESLATNHGSITCLDSNNNQALLELNEKTRKSTKYAVIVLHEDLKIEVRKYFKTPLIFSIQEAKGLEYANIILFNFISCEEQKYYEISKGITFEELNHDLTYARTKDKSDRSLEIYKFYINSLYVAITRAIDNIYIIEEHVKHPVIELLGLKNVRRSVTLSSEESSLEEWRQEARKLELQGKTEQAQEIKDSILGQKQLPWKPIDKKELEILKDKVFDSVKPDKDTMLLLSEYAIIYNQIHVIARLKALNFKPAQRLRQSMEIVEGKYYSAYDSNNFSAVISNIDKYGVDFRNQFNQTPLMIASTMGNVPLVQYLIENGADISLVDSIGRNPLQLALFQAYFSQKYAQTTLAQVYKLLLPTNISIKVAGGLIKIDSSSMEFFLFNLMMAIYHYRFAGKVCDHKFGFCTEDFIQPLEEFPESVLPESKKNRNYISNILSKNEVHGADHHNRMLFLRTVHGHYTLNPNLVIKIQDKWVPIYRYTLLALEAERI